MISQGPEQGLKKFLVTNVKLLAITLIFYNIR